MVGYPCARWCTWVSMSGTTTPWCTLLETGKVSSNKTGSETLHDHASDFIGSGRRAAARQTPDPSFHVPISMDRQPAELSASLAGWKRVCEERLARTRTVSHSRFDFIRAPISLSCFSRLSIGYISGFKPTHSCPSRLIVMDHNVFTLYTELDQIFSSWF
jgi:hypothetical protein